mmetsp:Transcript_2245/g.6884  ORF Transcript_2245/g.6884 Transcript_2245/m.6884 type:complete len:314 (-) Transcript_2245:184-1125(-)
MGFPAGLDDKDDSGKLAAFLLAFLAALAGYHSQLAREGRGKRARGRKSEPRRNYWDTVSALDLRYGAHTGIVTRLLLGFFRALALALCLTVWVVFWRSKACWADWQYLHVWNFAIVTLYFGLALLASLQPIRPGGTLRISEHAMVVLLEIIVPTTIFVFGLHWALTPNTPPRLFPVAQASWANDAFPGCCLGIVLLELGLNRIILSSRRWMYFGYLAAVYCLFIICVEKLSGNGHLVYPNESFLQLHDSSIPDLCILLICHFSSHYLGCVVVSIKQHFWTTPMSHPIEAAVGIAAGPGSRSLSEPLLRGRLEE